MYSSSFPGHIGPVGKESLISPTQAFLATTAGNPTGKIHSTLNQADLRIHDSFTGNSAAVKVVIPQTDPTLSSTTNPD